VGRCCEAQARRGERLRRKTDGLIQLLEPLGWDAIRLPVGGAVG
jgi:hypothetical protein